MEEKEIKGDILVDDVDTDPLRQPPGRDKKQTKKRLKRLIKESRYKRVCGWWATSSELLRMGSVEGLAASEGRHAIP